MKEFSNTAHSYFDLADQKKDGKVGLVRDSASAGRALDNSPKRVTLYILDLFPL
jgi:hypothetical protein